jgi:WD40 repeat protein
MTKSFVFLLILFTFSGQIHAQDFELDPLRLIQCEDHIQHAQIDPDRNRLFIYTEGKVHVHSLSKEKYKTLEVHLEDSITDPYYKTLFSPHGKYLIFYNLEDGIQVYKKSWGKYRFYALFTSKYRSVMVDINDQNQLVGGGPHGELSLWNLGKKKIIKTLKVDEGSGQVYTVRFIKDFSNRIVCGTGASKAILLDLENDSTLSEFKVDKAFQPDTSVAWSSAIPAKILEMQHHQFWIQIYNRPNHLLSWNAQGQKLIPIPLSVDLSDFTFFKDKLVVGTPSGEIFIHRSNGRSILKKIQAQVWPIQGLISSDTSNYLIAWGSKGKLQIWKYRTENKTKD